MSTTTRVFTRLDRVLRGRGFATVAAHDDGLLTADVAEAAARSGRRCAGSRRRPGTTASTSSGTVSRAAGPLVRAAQGGDEAVDTLATLSTPHGGTELAHLAPLVPLPPMTRQLAPGGTVVRAPAEPAPGSRTRFMAYASDVDHLVLPHRNARLEHPDLDVPNVDVHEVGHLSMPHHRPLAYAIAELLATDDYDPGHERPESVTIRAGGPSRT